MSRIQNYFSSEFLASGQSVEFNDFITKLTKAKSKAEETSHVTEELAQLGSKMGLPDVSSRRMKDYMIRLIHCFMLGYNVDFSVIYAIMASQSGETAMDRRVGYLACTLFLEHDHELGIMLINTLQRDLKSQNYLDRCAALNAICYLEHAEMLDNVLDLVIMTMDFPKQIVRKKAVMALYFLYERSDLDIKRIEPVLRQALDDKDSSVVFSALAVWKMILTDLVSDYQDLLPVFYSIHKQILENRIHKSFTYHGVLAPWAQLECLHIYKIYHDMNIGSPKDFYTMIVDCLKSMEKKVDTAFAIILECIKLLSSMDPILLGSLSTPDENPFQILVGYLHAANHNLKYLGILGMSFVDESFWKKDWLDGSLLAEIIQSSSQDITIITQAIENLDMIIDSEVLRNICPVLIDALSKNYDQKSSNTTIAYWLINRITEYHIEPSVWWVEAIMSIIAETRRNLDEDYVETQCHLLKEKLIEEKDSSELRKTSVDTAYTILKKTNSNRYSYHLLQFMIWTLGESGYLSVKYTDLDIMKQLQKWVQIVHDDYLQTCGLQAIKKCILRSKTWLSDLEKILKDYRKSPVLEKQEISRELLGLLQDTQYEKELQEADLTSSNLTINPNRPTGVGRFIDDSNLFTDQDGITFPINLEQNSYESSSHLQKTRFSSGVSSSEAGEGADLVSSLIELELDQSETMSTEQFGHLWVVYSEQVKRKFECSVTRCDKLAKKLSQSWHITVIEVIGQEFIALDNHVLIHVAMLPHKQFELTLRAKHAKDILRFLTEKQLK